MSPLRGLFRPAGEDSWGVCFPGAFAPWLHDAAAPRLGKRANTPKAFYSEARGRVRRGGHPGYAVIRSPNPDGVSQVRHGGHWV